MHENIKYTLTLDKSIKPLAKPGDLQDPQNADRASVGDWQCIFGEYLYSTHFFVYAKLLGTNKGNEFHVNRVQLYLQNYKGSVSMGFTNDLEIHPVPIDPQDPENDDRHPGKTRYEISFGLKGFNKKNNFVEVSLKNPLKLKDYDVIKAKPIYSPISSTISRIFEDDINNTDFVDELFMERIGEDVIISDEGRYRLRMLKAYGYDKQSLKLLDNSKISLVTKKANNYSEEKGLLFPCQPFNTMIRLKS